MSQTAAPSSTAPVPEDPTDVPGIVASMTLEEKLGQIVDTLFAGLSAADGGARGVPVLARAAQGVPHGDGGGEESDCVAEGGEGVWDQVAA